MKDVHKGFINKHAVAAMLDEMREAALQIKTESTSGSIDLKCFLIMSRTWDVAKALSCYEELEELSKRRIY
jgi:hypothetical protein